MCDKCMLSFVDILVGSTKEIDFSTFAEPVIKIYKNLENFPEKHVAVICDKNEPTRMYMVADCLRLLDFDIGKHTRLKFQADQEDGKYLIGVYK